MKSPTLLAATHFLFKENNMANQYVNKVIINGVTKLDLTGDTVAANKLLSGYTAHDKSGASITGTCPYNADTSDATVSADELLYGETAYGAAGTKITGTMANNGAVTGTISTKAGQYTVPQGYHDGSGKVSIAAAEQAKIIANNIREGVTILGVEGSLEPSSEVHIEPAKSVTPTFAVQQITPSSGYDAMAQVNVAAIPVTYVDNAQGGQTCTVG